MQSTKSGSYVRSITRSQKSYGVSMTSDKMRHHEHENEVT
jgi:hypothetical protein